MRGSLHRAVREALEAVADPDKAGAMQAYMKSEMPYLGVQKPERARTLRPILAALEVNGPASLAEAAAELWDAADYREERYAALDVLDARRHRKHHTWALKPLLIRFITEGAWWDLVDACSGPVGRLLLDAPDAMRRELRAWARGPDLWLRRSTMIAQLRFKTDLDFALLDEVIQSSLTAPGLESPLVEKDQRFFLAKAAGWALRTHARVDPDRVRQYLADQPELPKLTRREAAKHLG